MKALIIFGIVLIILFATVAFIMAAIIIWKIWKVLWKGVNEDDKQEN